MRTSYWHVLMGIPINLPKRLSTSGEDIVVSRVVKFFEGQIQDHRRLLLETDEAAHTETLFLRQLEYKQRFIEEHFPDNPYSKEMLVLIHKLRGLTRKSLEHKE